MPKEDFNLCSLKNAKKGAVAISPFKKQEKRLFFIEAGRRNFSVDILLTVTNSLHVTADWVLKGTPMGEAQIPTANAEVLATLDGLTADEIQDVILLVKDIKRVTAK